MHWVFHTASTPDMQAKCPTFPNPTVLRSKLLLQGEKSVLLLGPKAPSHKMGFIVFSSSSCCRFCTLNADWFTAPLLTVHHMLGQ